MSQGYHGFSTVSDTRSTAGVVSPQWEIVRGKVTSSMNSSDVFRGNEILETSVVDASIMDVSSTLLGRQRIQLQPGQKFPVRFEFYYDQSRTGRGHGGRTMQARITNTNGQLLYINDTHTEFQSEVKIDVRRV